LPAEAEPLGARQDRNLPSMPMSDSTF